MGDLIKKGEHRDSPLRIFAFPLRGRWREAPDEVVNNSFNRNGMLHTAQCFCPLIHQIVHALDGFVQRISQEDTAHRLAGILVFIEVPAAKAQDGTFGKAS